MDDRSAIRHPILRWLVYGHVWLAFAVAAQVWWTGLFLTEAPELWRWGVAAALGTFAAYGFMRWARTSHLPASEHLAWFGERRGWMLGLTVVCILVAVVLCWPPRWAVLRWLLPAAALAVLYVSPFNGRDGLTIGLRRIPGLKVIFVGVVWALVVVAVPMEYDLVVRAPIDTLMMVCMRFPLFVGLTIAFDLRDLPYDPPVLRTLPQVMGRRGAKAIAAALLAFSALLEHVFLRGLDHDAAAWIVLLPYAVAIGLVTFASPKRGPLYYGIAIDGIMILIPLCVWSGMHL